MARVDRTERLLNVVFCLLGAARPVSRAQIRASVSGYDPDASDAAFERMFERDKDELRSMGIGIETIVDVHGEVEGYLIRRQNASAELQFNADELALLGLAAAISQEAIIEASTTTALRKIETVSGDAPDSVHRSNMRVNATDAALLPLMSSLREQRMVSFDYQGRNDRQAEKRSVDPWGVIAHEGAWYLVGHDRDRQAQRTFRLSRIQGSVTITAKNIECSRPVNLSLVDIVRGEQGEQHVTARVHITAGYGAALRQAHAGGLSPFADIEIEVRAISEDALVSQICAAGFGVKVLEPISVQERVIASLLAVSHYHVDAV
ncbi:MAG: WYL domain-containing protein [Actinobacteria bacterium]|nr:WYL domain-containing protein [Actinomycetota bacterium]